MDELAKRIDEIGREMVCCKRDCAGIVCDHRTGQIPRCLFLDTEKRTGKRGAVIVGSNPGESDSPERQFYVDRGSANEDLDRQKLYDSMKEWMGRVGLVSGPYYLRLYSFLDALNALPCAPDLTGPVLWTELVKCESTKEEGKLPVQTTATCADLFLLRELKLVPDDWPIIAAGLEAYDFLRHGFPRRKIIGVPHPTGRYSELLFLNLFDRASHVDPDRRNRLATKFADESDNVLRGWIRAVRLQSSRK